MAVAGEGQVEDWLSVGLLLLHGRIEDFLGQPLARWVDLAHGATTVVLVDRPGVPASTFGYSWDLGGDYTFDDSAANGTWDSIGTGGVSPLASGSYQSENPLAAFNGQELSGAWTLSISDNAAADTGSLQGWTLTATVPTPSSMALLGLGGLVAGRRRR